MSEHGLVLGRGAYKVLALKVFGVSRVQQQIDWLQFPIPCGSYVISRAIKGGLPMP